MVALRWEYHRLVFGADDDGDEASLISIARSGARRLRPRPPTAAAAAAGRGARAVAARRATVLLI